MNEETFNTHIRDEQWNAFYEDTLSMQERIELLSHTSRCDFCAMRMAAGLPGHKQITPPRDLKESILKAAERTPQYYLPRKQDKKKFLLFYSLRVGAATFGAVALLIVSMITGLTAGATPADSYENYITKKEAAIQKELNELKNQQMQEYDSYLDRINDRLRSFSQDITDSLNQLVTPKNGEANQTKTEVNNHD